MGNLAERIDKIIAIDPAAHAVEFEKIWTTWGDIGATGSALTELLVGEGLGADSRIGLMLRNHGAMVPAIYAAIAARCLVTLNPMLNPDKLAAEINNTALPAVIGLARDLDPPAVKQALARSGCLVIEMTGDKSAPIRVRQQRSAANRSSARTSAPGVALEMLTSGTTGTPKRIPMRRDAFEMSVFGTARFEKGRAENDAPRLRSGVQLLMAPLSHISGLLALMNSIAAGRSIALLERFRVEDFRDVVSRHRMKAASIPPAALKMLYDADVPVDDLASLRAFRVGTAPLEPDLADAVYNRYGIPILQNYGATEFGGVAGWTLDDFKAHRVSHRGSVGRLNPGIEGRTVDPASGTELFVGQTGILELRSTQIGDGRNWTRTTDLARLDHESFLWILGRADNAIIRGGFKIQPDEVARAIESHPAVVEASVVGIADSRLGQVPGAAYIVARGVTDPGADGLQAYLREKLTSYQVPVIYKAVQELPRTASMKADTVAVKALLQPLHGAVAD